MTPLCASTAKKSSLFNRSRLQNRNSHELFPPPPPEFLYTEKQPIIRAHGPGLKDGFVLDHCSYNFHFLLFFEQIFVLNFKGHFDLNAPDAELQKLVIAIDGPSKADIQIEVIETGIYRVYYKCQSPGK